MNSRFEYYEARSASILFFLALPSFIILNKKSEPNLQPTFSLVARVHVGRAGSPLAPVAAAPVAAAPVVGLVERACRAVRFGARFGVPVVPRGAAPRLFQVARGPEVLDPLLRRRWVWEWVRKHITHIIAHTQAHTPAKI